MIKRRMRRLQAIFSTTRWRKHILTALLCLCCQAGIASSADDVASFTFSSDPTEIVMLISYTGGMTGIHPSFRLYGDGRLLYTLTDVHGQDLERHEFFLDYHEMEDLLRVAVDHNLLEASDSDIQTKLKAQNAGDSPKIADATSMIFRIAVTSFKKGGEQLGPRSNLVTVHAPTLLERTYDIPEIHGCAILSRRMSDLERSLKRKDLP